jgi:REP element-mobilizing transposase RayT
MKTGLHMNYSRQHNRRSIRLRGYDYSSPGEYFITICTNKRECLFGDIENGEMVLNELGIIARDEWTNTENIRDNVKLDRFVIMPNHMHAIFQITNIVGAYGDTPLQCGGTTMHKHVHRPQNDEGKSTNFKSPSNTVGAIVRGYKSAVTTKINTLHQRPGQKIWQRNYYEHIIRNVESLNRIRKYILNNPARWEGDMNHPLNRE